MDWIPTRDQAEAQGRPYFSCGLNELLSTKHDLRSSGHTRALID